MIGINDFKLYFTDLINPAQTGNEMGPDAFNRQLAVVVTDAVRRHLGLPEAYSPAMPLPAIAYEKTQMITDELAEIKTSAVILLSGGDLYEIPSDFYYPSSIYHTVLQPLKKINNPNYDQPQQQAYNYEDWPVSMVNDAEFNIARMSAVRKPTSDYPIARIFGSVSNKLYMQLQPKGISAVTLTYIRKPKKPYWNYVFDPQTNTEVYVPTGSQDIELPESMITTLAILLAQRLGISTRDTQLYQMMNNQQNKGT